jgi:hypothetical protein
MTCELDTNVVDGVATIVTPVARMVKSNNIISITVTANV